jgi:superfamily I DNA/RNA helicase
MRGEPARWHADLGAFKRWADVVEYVKSGDGSDIGTLVRMVENYGADTLYEVCDNARDEGEADVVLSTAHKAKGREWDRVMIGGDFAPSEDRERAGLSRSEAMLMYVAVTRAKLALDASALTWARGMVVA